METRRLEYFLRIADAGSINRAAASLGIAQPALSQQLAILETELKVALFTRSRTGVSLTDAGRRLYPRAQTLLRHFDSLTLGDPDGRSMTFVAVGLPPTLVMPIGLPLAEQVMDAHPRIRLHIIEASALLLVDNLLSGALDIAVIPSAPADPAIEAEPIAREEMMIVTAAGASPPPTGAHDLAALPWIVTRYPNVLRGVLSAWFLQSEREPRVAAEVNSLPVVLELVERGRGVTLLPRSAVAARVAAGTLAVWPMRPEPLHRTVSLCRRIDAPTGPSFTTVEELIRGLAGTQLQPAG